jgi:hypothetical protein
MSPGCNERANSAAKASKARCVGKVCRAGAAKLSAMSSGEFEAELEQSVQDHLAFVANAASAAKARIGEAIESGSASAAPPSDLRPAVDFSTPEPDFDPALAAGSDPGTPEADAFAAEPAPSPLPEGAISFDDLAVEGVDDEGVPVWEDPP